MNVPQIHVSAPIAMLDEPVQITLRGFAPNQIVTVRATLTNGMAGGVLNASSHAVFRTDDEGCVDLSTEAPLSGTYSGADSMGLFWSMDVHELRFHHAHSLDHYQFSPRSADVILTAEVSEKIVAKTAATRLLISPEVSIRKVREHGLVGQFFYQSNMNPRPAILVLGGSEGGIGTCSQFAALFASHGYPALALAYFHCDYLPDQIRQIPLEYLQEAIRWMKRQPNVNHEQIAVFGRSKGAELALVIGSIEPAVRAVIASSPSSAVCIGTDRESAESDVFSPQSSWSSQGKGLPYAVWTEEECRSAKELLHQEKRIDHIHAEAWKRSRSSEETAIRVEHINGPVFLISSGDDHWWPAMEHCTYMAERLHQKGFSHNVTHLNYPEAGHGIRFPYIPTTRLKLNGGTAEANAHASAHSWRAVLQFLQESFPE